MLEFLVSWCYHESAFSVSEDRETLRSDLSAGAAVCGKGGALCITFFLCRIQPLPVPPCYGNLNALNLGVRGKAPA